jgi:EAL and modified HD-GYP domain-containing signal transduction protein
LKDKGYSIALDDFEYDESKRELVGLADRIKVDVLNNPDVAATVNILRQFPVTLLAEKVETHEQYALMTKLGFTMFQGYFFCRPQVVAGMRLPDSKLAVMRALKEVSTAESVDQLYGVIGHDVNLSYKLLRYINSAAFGFRIKIESIEQALNLLGLETMRRWLTVLSLAMLGEDKPLELVRQAMLRGKLMEEIARLLGRDRLSDYFVLGMFSLLDALLDQPLEIAVQDIALPEVVRQGLFDAKSGPARKLTLLHDIERADWRGITVGCRLLGLDFDAVMKAQGNAAVWLEEYSAMLSGN